MFVEEPEATGNEPATSGELPSEEETQAPGVESREPEPETNWKDKYLAAKSAEEEANRLRRENEDLRRAQQPVRVVDDEDAEDLTPEELAALRAAKRQGDIYAKATLRDRAEREKDRQEREELASALARQREYLDIEDVKERKAVRARFDPNKHRDLRDAEQEIKTERQGAEIKRLLAENERLQKGGKPADPNVTRTHTREVGATEHARRMPSDDEFKARQAGLTDDDERRREQMERRKKLMNQ